MPKCSGPTFCTLGWMDPEGLATEVGRRERRAVRRDMMAIRTPPGLGEETSRNPQDSPDGWKRGFLSQKKLHTRGQEPKSGDRTGIRAGPDTGQEPKSGIDVIPFLPRTISPGPFPID